MFEIEEEGSKTRNWMVEKKGFFYLYLSFFNSRVLWLFLILCFSVSRQFAFKFTMFSCSHVFFLGFLMLKSGTLSWEMDFYLNPSNLCNIAFHYQISKFKLFKKWQLNFCIWLLGCFLASYLDWFSAVCSVVAWPEE